jgi:uracil-DNA glycosylase
VPSRYSGQAVHPAAVLRLNGRLFTATVHPSSILRAQDDASRHAQMRAFVKDLKAIARRMQ